MTTEDKHTYFPSVITNDRLYQLKITDLPPITSFPADSYHEWANYRFYGLRNATAYIMVFDLSDVDTFKYVRSMREQIAESRDIRNVPLLVVGNKQDRLMTACSGGGAVGSGAVVCGGQSGHHPGDIGGNSVEKRRDIQNLVKKHWKCGYVECSARYNWRVVAVFKELIKTVDATDTVTTYKEVYAPMIDNIHDALDRNKCVVS